MATAGKPELPDPNEKLVKVFDSEQETEVMVVKGLLESAGVEAIARNVDNPQDLFPVGGVTLLVRASQADEARRLIDEYRAGGEEAADRAEAEAEAGGEVSEEPMA